MTQTALFEETMTSGITPRNYQSQDLESSFRLWDNGEVGTLTRIATGLGKTICSCLKIQRWLDRGPDYRAMILSYEITLVEQFADEIKDVLGINPGIEMAEDEISPRAIPRIVVASRQTLQSHELTTQEQLDELAKLGLKDFGMLTKSAARKAINDLRAGCDIQQIADGIAELQEHYSYSAKMGKVSRLYKFDYRDNWLLVMDEAHKYSMKQATVPHIIEWFEQNATHRRSGITATPKRRDNVSIGTKLFPGIAIDYPLTKAVQEGYAVPYRQKFIQVESIDFAGLKAACGKSQEKWDQALDEQLNTEETLAKLCEPMLELVGERKTLIFSPSVDMADNVANYVNARSQCECPSCGTKRWYPNLLLGDGAKCRECGDFITTANIQRGGVQAHCIHGGTPKKSRKEIYREHQSGVFQFLSVCGLCREGYNDPDISAVTIFRPVSRAASSLAEQMKGRGSRVVRKCIDGLDTAAERLKAISESRKPDCLIVDLVGVTGLADCASTVQIYAEGLPDDIIARAEEIALEGGVDDPAKAIEQAQREDAEEKERLRLKRESEASERRRLAAERAKLDAQVTYSQHDIGSRQPGGYRDPSLMSEGQERYLHMLGMDFIDVSITKKQAGRMIGQLNGKDEPAITPEEAAYTNRISSENWKPARGSQKQIAALRRRGIDAGEFNPQEIQTAFDGGMIKVISLRLDKASTTDAVTTIARMTKDAFDKRQIKDTEYKAIVESGRNKRESLNKPTEQTPPTADDSTQEFLDS